MIYDYTGGMFMSAMLALKAPMPFIRDFSLVLALLGAGVGLVGSFVSIRRFLKILAGIDLLFLKRKLNEKRNSKIFKSRLS